MYIKEIHQLKKVVDTKAKFVVRQKQNYHYPTMSVHWMELSDGENDVVGMLLCMCDSTQQSTSESIKNSRPLQVPECEIFDRLDFHAFYTWAKI